ncbi:CDP-diacylglycerol--glycerol-3-phosphate 3-phosphatidyltransferase [Oleiphilus messinensis]|uniref:CDP-diacylglycerol--glycerol-3-phosphate 3-phosphatidyltransferase n=1 Tax=Oleiphilus messinensis TaxID=141451 RepID=A0A1Y0IA03_9GAMM|nr:CDP-diacylglycerol--glycerol-3-phosphate 3-phosphatidyltransferase [Oleiphilus messinensis]ARU56223.1 CDP-diacylglycerol--glycerol-3-phosphate 3-phosphatidyltransferase [Oleiphilus messinensis]
MNLPNILTFSRILMIPIFVLVFFIPWKWSYIGASALFALAGVTDWLDGYLARRWNQATAFGAFLDPVADKLMVAVALMVLVHDHASIWVTLPSVVIVGREIVISALREWMAEMGKRASVAVSYLGKIKTACQMISIVVLLANEPKTDYSYFGLALLYVAAVLTLWSMIIYIRAAWPDLSPFRAKNDLSEK